MIKEYKTIISVYGKQKKVAIIICDDCKTEFTASAIDANQGRRYCNMECVANARNFNLKDIIKIKK